jgi:hypothetical protein
MLSRQNTENDKERNEMYTHINIEQISISVKKLPL